MAKVGCASQRAMTWCAPTNSPSRLSRPQLKSGILKPLCCHRTPHISCPDLLHRKPHSAQTKAVRDQKSPPEETTQAVGGIGPRVHLVTSQRTKPFSPHPPAPAHLGQSSLSCPIATLSKLLSPKIANRRWTNACQDLIFLILAALWLNWKIQWIKKRQHRLEI